jgi:hypothetical protein
MGLKTLAMTNRRFRLWTEEEDNLLRTMAAAGKSMTLITAKLGRPIGHIKARAHNLHITLPGEDKTAKRWAG